VTRLTDAAPFAHFQAAFVCGMYASTRPILVAKNSQVTTSVTLMVSGMTMANLLELRRRAPSIA
jgi:hypothetical protein